MSKTQAKITYAWMGEELREDLAEYAHDAWAGWMKYMFSKGEIISGTDSEGKAFTRCVIPTWAVERWMRQMNTPYAELPESEKESDRDEADKMLEIVCHSDFGRG